MFENIIGNEKNKKILENSIKNRNILHSYIFVGKSGIGKMLFAKEFAKAILCTAENKPCNKCKSCLEFDNLNNPDINIITLDKDKLTIKIEQIREMIRKTFEKPIVSDKKVYIINESDLMTPQAQNSLLKTLEEPQDYITIILIAKNDNMFLPTIKSRCTKVSFNKLEDEEVKQILKQKHNYTNINNTILKIADGSVEKAISLMESEYNYENIYDIFSNIEKSNMLNFINNKEKIFTSKENVNEILEYINIIFLNKIKENNFNKGNYTNCIKTVEETKERLSKNNNYDMTLDRFLMTVWEEING